MSGVTVCWDLDTAYLATRKPILCSRVSIWLSVWSSSRMHRIIGTIVLALLNYMGVLEEAGAHARLNAHPRKGNSESGVNEDEGEEYVHCGETVALRPER